MATWHVRTAQQMSELVRVQGFSDAQISQLRVETGRWADMIGKENTKLFIVGNYHVRVTAYNHEVTDLEVAQSIKAPDYSLPFSQSLCL